jgi:hypothetical protein
MNVESASQLLLPFVAAAFVAFGVAGAVATRMLGRGGVVAARALLCVIWLCGALAIASIGYRQYGLQAALPAALAVGLSVAIVYAIARRGGGQSSWLLAAVRGAIAASLATALLPVSLLLFLALLGIDGP